MVTRPSPIDEHSFSAAEIYNQVQRNLAYNDDVEAWNTICLLKGKMSEARAGFRACVSNFDYDDERVTDKQYIINAQMTALEVEAYLREGYLMEALTADGIRRAYVQKARHDLDHKHYAIGPEMFVLCGDRCLERKDFKNALEAYSLAKSWDGAFNVHQACVLNGETELAKEAYSLWAQLGCDNPEE